MARLAKICTGHKRPAYSAPIAAKQQTDVAPLCHYITSQGPPMTRLLNVARAIFDPPGSFKWEGLSTLLLSAI